MSKTFFMQKNLDDFGTASICVPKSNDPNKEKAIAGVGV